METDKKLYVALVVLAALGGAVYLNNQKQATEAAAHSVSGAKAELPTLKLSADAIKEIDKVVIKKPADGDGGAPEEFTLVKKGEEDWELEQPLTAKANASNVKSLLDSLERLEVKEQISPSAESYEKWGVTDAKALHATLYKGEEVKFDAYFGEDGSRGQMTRVAGTDGVYAIKGYSKFTFARDMKGWRDKTIFKFEDKDAVKVTVENENGTFSFEKEGDKWSGKHTGTEKGDKAKDIDGFKESKVTDLLRAYKALNASDFGDKKARAEVGLDTPKATVTIELKGGTGKYSISVGDNAEGSSRWAVTNKDEQIYAISSWSADWATADASKFKDTPPKDDEPPPVPAP